MKITAVITFILSVSNFTVSEKSCDENQQCGLGGGCERHKQGVGGYCNCSYTQTLFKEDSFGNCSEIVKYCSQKDICSNNGTCYDVFSSFYCSCIEGCYGKHCGICFTFREGMFNFSFLWERAYFIPVNNIVSKLPKKECLKCYSLPYYKQVDRI